MAKRRKLTISKAMYDDFISLAMLPHSTAEVLDAICRYALNYYPQAKIDRILSHRISTHQNDSVKIYISTSIIYDTNTIRSILAYQLPIAHEYGVKNIVYPVDYYRYFTVPLHFKPNVLLDKSIISWLRIESKNKDITIARLVEDTILAWQEPTIPQQIVLPIEEKAYIHIKWLSGAVRAWLEERSIPELNSKTINAILQNSITIA